MSAWDSVALINAGLARAKEKIAREGHFKSKAGKIRKRRQC